jgi:hypothetical protein
MVAGRTRLGDFCHRAPLVSIGTSPLQLVCMDYLTLEPSKGGQPNILIITNHFTRYAQAIQTINQTARTTAEVLFNNTYHYPVDGSWSYETWWFLSFCTVPQWLLIGRLLLGGRYTLDLLFMRTTVHSMIPQAFRNIIWCLVEIPDYQSTLFLVYERKLRDPTT